MEIKNKQIWNKGKAFLIIVLILGQLLGVMLISYQYRSFASAEIYTMDNVIYFSATVMGKSTPEVMKLVISEKAQEIPDEYQHEPIWKINNPFEIKVDDIAFLPTPNFTQSLESVHNIYSIWDLPNGITNYKGFQVNTTYAEKAVLSNYIDSTQMENYSEYLQNFDVSSQYYVVNSKSLFFAEPLYYVEKFCGDNGYVLDEIYNATYIDTTNYNTLNAYVSEIVNTEYLVTSDDSYYSPTLSKGLNIWQRSQLENNQVESKCPWCLIILVIALIICVPTICDALLESQRIEVTADLAKEQIWADANVTINAINAEKEIQLALVENKAENEELIIDLYTNGSISFEEMQVLLKQTQGSYDSLLNNRTLNIQSIGNDYYNHTEEMWSLYKNALGVSTTWTNWLMWIIYIAIGLLVIYFIYVFISRKAFKGSGNSAQNTIFITAPTRVIVYL